MRGKSGASSWTAVDSAGYAHGVPISGSKFSMASSARISVSCNINCNTVSSRRIVGTRQGTRARMWRRTDASRKLREGVGIVGRRPPQSLPSARASALASGLPEELAGVDRLALHEDFVVEMGPRAPPGAPHAPDHLSLLDLLADLHLQHLQVGVARLHALTVRQHYVLAVAALGAGGDDRPRRRRRDRRPGRTADVDPGVTLPRPIPGGLAQPKFRIDLPVD